MSNGNFTGHYLTNLSSEPEFIQALNTVLPVISAQKTTLGMTAQQVTDLTNLCNAFIASYSTATTAKLAAKSAVATKESQRKAAQNSLFAWVKQWRANTAIPDALLEQLMVAPHKTPGTKTAPTTPTSFQAVPNGLGVVKFTWDRNGNTSSTTFVIESRKSPTDDWAVAFTTTKTKFELQVTPGQYIAFRIYANRNNTNSVASAPVILWENGGTGSATLKIAA